MIRMATIAFLIVINVSVWIGPAETILDRSVDAVATPPGLEAVEMEIVRENFRGALALLNELVAAEPENGAYRYELAMFCYLYSDFMLGEAGWSRDTLIETVQRNLRHARRLQPDDYELARQYARLQIDEQFLDNDIPREAALEAWQYTLESAIARHDTEPEWYGYPHEAAHALLNMARVEARYGNAELAQGYLDRIPAFAPDFRVPENVIQIHAELAAS